MPVPQPGTGFLWINYRGLLTQIRKLARLQESLNKDIDVSPAIRGMAKEWQRNFDSEGGMVGGWKKLSPSTLRLRKKRGYGPGPILVQSGGLRRAAIEYPLSFSKKTMTRTVPGSGHTWAGGPTTINIRTSPNRAKMVLSGDKVKNNTGSKSKKKPLPKRPFWYVDMNVRQSGAEELAEDLQEKYFKEFK